VAHRPFGQPAGLDCLALLAAFCGIEMVGVRSPVVLAVQVAAALSDEGTDAIVVGDIWPGNGKVVINLVSPVFAGTPGNANCRGQSVFALAQQFGGLNNAAAALGYPSMDTLQNAIREFCGG
jgi:hypothetical protein